MSDYDGDQDKNSYDFDHDHYHFIHGLPQTDKDSLTHTFNYGSAFKHGFIEGADKKASNKKPSKVPKKFIGKDSKGKKYEFTYYDGYKYPTTGFKSEFVNPKELLKTLDKAYQVKTQKTNGPHLKLVTPTKATLISYGPTQSTYKNSYVGPTVISYVDSGFVSPKSVGKPTIVPYKQYHTSSPLNEEFKEYNARKENTENYVHSDDKPLFAYPASHLQSPHFDSVRDGIIGFATEVRERYGGKEMEPDKYTLEQFRKEDEQDAKEHEEFVTSIENDHKAF